MSRDRSYDPTKSSFWLLIVRAKGHTEPSKAKNQKKTPYPWQERMSSGGADSHRYIVSPVSARARVRRERTELPLRSRTRPRLAAYLSLDTVLLDLTSVSLSDASAPRATPNEYNSGGQKLDLSR